MKLFLVICAVFAICSAEAPLSGPYAPSGWKPNGPQLTLPTQFLPQPQQRQNEPVDVEVNKEQVNFAGQTTETEEATPEPNKAYLPPESNNPEENGADNVNYLKVQGLPGEEDATNFAEPQNEQSGQYRFQDSRQFGRLKQQPQRENNNFDRQQQQQQQFVRLAPQQQNTREYQQENIDQYQQFGRQVAAAPAQEYGAPRNVPSVVDEEEEEAAPVQESEENGQPAVSVSNSLQSGRYYVLTPDNTLQRVAFRTTQNEEEVRTNGFTAQLRYMPVEPIRDPIYAYNEQGVLVRIYRK